VVEKYLQHNVNCEYNWDTDVTARGDYPRDSLVEKIWETISADEPMVIGFVTKWFNWVFGRSIVEGHYALGLGKAYGTGYMVLENELPGGATYTMEIPVPVRYMLVDMQHGNGEEDLVWFNFNNIFGAWAIPRWGIQPCPREETIQEKGPHPHTVDMASLNDEIYMAYPKGRDIHIRKTEAANYPYPVNNGAINPVNFDKLLILPSNRYHYSQADFEQDLIGESVSSTPTVGSITEITRKSGFPEGPVSICTWNYNKNTDSLSQYISEPPSLENDLWSIINWRKNLITKAIQYDSELHDEGEKSEEKTQRHLIQKPALLERAIKIPVEERKDGILPLGELAEIAPIKGYPFEWRSGSYIFLCWRGPKIIL
jgi:hypothetical protein